MNCNIEVTPRFAKELKALCKRYKSLKNDYSDFINELRQNPDMGVDLGGNIHKVRMSIASKNKGKSHGARVITYLCTVDETAKNVILLTIYDKADRSSVSKEEILHLVSSI